MKINTKLAHNKFMVEHGIIVEGNDYGFKTHSDANKYAKLKCEWWGSNLVYLGAKEENGLWFPGFNVWD